jgi:twinkle protein
MSSNNKPCPVCRQAGRDSKGDHLWLMADGITYCCNRNEYHPDGKQYLEREGEEVKEVETEAKGTYTIAQVQALPSDRYIRDITPEVVQRYRIHVEYDTATGEQVRHFYPITVDKGKKLLGYKVREVQDKKFWKTVSTKGLEVDLFGTYTIIGKPEHLLFCEGECDAAAAFQVLHRKYPGRVAVVSLPDGANMKAIRENKEVLDNCHNLYFFPDGDEVGEKLVPEVAALFPNVRIIRTSEKDACDLLKAGKDAELVAAFEAAERYKPKSIISVSEVLEEAIEEVKWGLDYPYQRLTEMTFGYRTKQLIGIGAAPGAGKTSLTEVLQKCLIFDHKQKVGIFSLEDAPSQTLRKLIGSVMKKPIHLPTCTYDKTTAKIIGESFQDYVSFYDYNEYTDWRDVESAIRFFASDGVKYFFIDPLSALVAHLGASEANTYLNDAMMRMSKLVKNLDITIYHVNHLNNSSTGKDHGAGGKVYGSQFSGSRAMWKFSTALWGLERNQLAETEEERNTVTLSIIKDRMGGKTGSFELHYDKHKGTLEEPTVSGVF